MRHELASLYGISYRGHVTVAASIIKLLNVMALQAEKHLRLRNFSTRLLPRSLLVL
jgi:hypothetical protein